MSYFDKYLKYKNKYLELKNMVGSGEDKQFGIKIKKEFDIKIKKQFGIGKVNLLWIQNKIMVTDFLYIK